MLCESESTQLFDRRAGFGLPQKSNDLFFREPLLHARSAQVMGPDSNLKRYSERE